MWFSVRHMGTAPGLCGSKSQSRPTGSPWAPLLEVSSCVARATRLCDGHNWSVMYQNWGVAWVWACVCLQQPEPRLCTRSTWWRLVCRTRDPRGPLLGSWCTRTALTVLRRCFATRVSLASIEVGQKGSALTRHLCYALIALTTPAKWSSAFSLLFSSSSEICFPLCFVIISLMSWRCICCF